METDLTARRPITEQGITVCVDQLPQAVADDRAELKNQAVPRRRRVSQPFFAAALRWADVMLLLPLLRAPRLALDRAVLLAADRFVPLAEARVLLLAVPRVVPLLEVELLLLVPELLLGAAREL